MMINDDAFIYDNGVLRWALNAPPKGVAGEIAGGICTNGYWGVSYQGVRDYAHRIIWRKFHGDIPEGFDVDHKNFNRIDNRIENLRLLPHSINSGLTRCFKGGVTIDENKFRVRINRVSYGRFDNLGDAIAMADAVYSGLIAEPVRKPKGNGITYLKDVDKWRVMHGGRFIGKFKEYEDAWFKMKALK